MATYMAQLHPLIGAHNFWSKCCRRRHLIVERVCCRTCLGRWTRVSRFCVGLEPLYYVSQSTYFSDSPAETRVLKVLRPVSFLTF